MVETSTMSQSGAGNMQTPGCCLTSVGDNMDGLNDGLNGGHFPFAHPCRSLKIHADASSNALYMLCEFSNNLCKSFLRNAQHRAPSNQSTGSYSPKLPPHRKPANREACPPEETGEEGMVADQAREAADLVRRQAKFVNTFAVEDNRAPRKHEPCDERVLKFKRLVTTLNRGAGTSESLFSLGLDVLTDVDSASAKQDIITLLASEDGLSCILQVADSRIPRAVTSGTTFAKRRLWENDLSPLFRLVTFKSVVQSNVLEEKVTTIYNFLAGVGGSRLPTWFGLAKALAQAPDLPSSLPSIAIAELCLAVLSKMMECNASHLSIPEFRDYATSFISIADGFEDVTPDTKLAKIQAMEYAAYLSRRLEAREAGTHAISLYALSSSSMHRDLPGVLSGDGPRHDNDHDDIAKISILPTQVEIASVRNEYLPLVDPATWHRQGISGRLDREFRLLREDTVGQLRDVVRIELGNLQQQSNLGRSGAPGGLRGRGNTSNPKNAIRYCTYYDTSITAVDFDRRTGPEFLVRFRQPAGRAGASTGKSNKARASGQEDKDQAAKSLAQRRNWWLMLAKKRLQPGALVCVIDSRGSSHFLVVANSTVRSVADPQRRQHNSKGYNHNDKEKDDTEHTLADDPSWSFVRLLLVPGSDCDQLRVVLTQLLFQAKVDKYTHSGAWLRREETPCVLVEFPGILLDSFMPSLRALQAAAASLNVPFADLLAAPSNLSATSQSQYDTDSDDDEYQVASIPPPKYAQKPGFAFDMSCLSQDGVGQCRLRRHAVDNPITPEEVEKQTRLDATQSVALIDALSRSMALIQGPPGTGKTFAGVEILKVLLHNREAANLGPIMIVCYTNHALDQLLEHTLDARAETRIVRIGSQSKSVRLKEFSLYDLSRDGLRTKIERQTLAVTGKYLDASTKKLQMLSGSLGHSMSFSSVARYLQKHHKSYFIQIFGHDGDTGVDEDGFATVRESQDKTILRWMRANPEANIPKPAALAVPETTETTETPETTETIEPIETMQARLQHLEDSTNLDLSSLSADERRVMYRKWQHESFSLAADSVSRVYRDFVRQKKEYDDARRETDLRCLQGAEVVGVTTTGLARNLDLLKNLQSKVLLCEEAGEVLEAHMLTSLIPSLEHVILIGDHQQLRPQVQNFDLRSDSTRGAQYSFDMSLFERLVSPADEDEVCLPYSQLFTQRRMHPSISDLIRAPLYPSLQDGSNVLQYPGVPGIERRLFWLQHEQLEKGASSGDQQADPTSTSRTNLFEVDMTAALVSHLLKQGAYGPGDIAVLTPYVGQMMLLQRRMSSMFEISFNERDEAELETAAAIDAGRAAAGGDAGEQAGEKSRAVVAARDKVSNSVRIATVDNFQGEEAKVVVVSMVRSNEQQRCGFLSTSNRINVLLSRAKHGMYIIGNSQTCSRVPMWRDVIASLEERGNIGPALPLRCPRHPERKFEASKPEHFSQFAPDGGCLETCNKPLPCTHMCKKPCHSDVVHAAVQCVDPCMRPQAGCSHSCPRRCCDTCPRQCSAVLAGAVLKLACGHSIKPVACWQAQKPETVECGADVERRVPGCGHVVSVKCRQSDEVTGEKYKCQARCGSVLPCGHICPKRCCECKTRIGGKVSSEKHGVCRSPCGQPHATCEHSCRKPCHADEGGARTSCPPCEEPCSVRCSHTRCKLKCSDSCVPCEERCSSQCPHSSCSLPCAAPCDGIPCSKKCEKQLSCGHECPSLCGEPCPGRDFCQVCAAADTLGQIADPTTNLTYGSVTLDEDPCIFLSCGHVFSVSYMDGVMEMARFYELADGRPVAIEEAPAPFSIDSARTMCPHCRRSLRGVARYGRIVRQSLMDTSVKQCVTQTNAELLQLACRLQSTMESLQQPKNAANSKSKWRKTAVGGTGRVLGLTKLLTAVDEPRYRPLLEVRGSIAAYAKQTRLRERPYVAEKCEKSEAGDANGAKDEHAGGRVRMSGYMRARLLLLQCDSLALLHVASLLASQSDADVMRVTSDARDRVVAGIKAAETAMRAGLFADVVNDCEAMIQEARAADSKPQELEAMSVLFRTHNAFARLHRLWVAQGPVLVGADDGDEATQQRHELEGALADELERVSDAACERRTMRAAYVGAGPARALLLAALDTWADYRADQTSQPAQVAGYAAGVTRLYRAWDSKYHGLSGQWHACVNGHPFTTAGGAVVDRERLEAECPECCVVPVEAKRS